jgi:hypothetical protein
MPFNRDRIYQGSVEAAAFRSLLNPWTWRNDPPSRSIMEQLELQPPGVPADDVITRTNGGTNDGHVNFSFDAGFVSTEPAPVGAATASIGYQFDGTVGATTTVQRSGDRVTLHAVDTPLSGEGRAVQFFDLLGGADGNFNQTRIGNELANHRFATGFRTARCASRRAGDQQGLPRGERGDQLRRFEHGHRAHVRPGLLHIAPRQPVAEPDRLGHADPPPEHAASQGRHREAQSRPGWRCVSDVAIDAGDRPDPAIRRVDIAGHQHVARRLRQEVFRRSIDAGAADSTVMGGFYVDREIYSSTNTKIALYRYLLEPLGVSVDKWSMGVRGRSRTYTFADVFGTYTTPITSEIEASLAADPFPDSRRRTIARARPGGEHGVDRRCLPTRTCRGSPTCSASSTRAASSVTVAWAIHRSRRSSRLTTSTSPRKTRLPTAID